MQKRVLGRTNIEVSEISFGAASIGFPYGMGLDSDEDLLPEAEAVKLLQSALDKGITLYDTARKYGRSEKLIGKAFKDRRKEVVICTKAVTLVDKNRKLFPDDRIKPALDNSLRESLTDLQTDFIDVYMLHTPGYGIPTNEVVMETLSGYKQKGLTRAIGVSLYTVEQAESVIESGIWDVVEVGYNLMDQRVRPAFDLLTDHGLGIIIRSVLFKGILTDKGRNLHPKLDPVKRYRETYNELLTEKIPKLSGLAIRFVLSHPQISSALVGIDTQEYLDKALAAANGEYLDESTLIRAKELAYPDPEFLNLGKWDVEGWLR